MILILAFFSAAAGSQDADLLVQNARIYTVNPALPRTSALAVKDGRILALGPAAIASAGPHTKQIDARGAAIIPGLIDSHVHMQGLGDMLDHLDFRALNSVEAIAGSVRTEAARRAAGEWIRGRNWDQTKWGGSFPSEAPLTAAAPDHPVFLVRVDGHAAWVNRKALELAGIHATTRDPPGGRILRYASGAPTGILIDNAMKLVASRMPPPTPGETRRALERAARQCASVGLTSVHDAGVTAMEIDAYRALLREHRLPVRVYAMIGGVGKLWDAWLDRGPEIGDRLTIRAIKLYADGALGSRGAALKQPYTDDPGNTGLLLLSRQEIEQVARTAAQRGFQVCTHAIGDRANRTVLEAYGAVLEGPNNRRFRIEHAQVVSLDDIPLFVQYSILASMQATHATSDMRWAVERLGPDRLQGAYAWRRFLAIGVHVPNGSDFPVEDPNPLPGFYAAITRQDRDGNPPGGWFPGQRMTREEALRSWTIEGAYAAFEENTKGSLAPGKLADFVMLSKDIMRIPPREILSTRVLMTVLGGEIVYSEAQ